MDVAAFNVRRVAVVGHELRMRAVYVVDHEIEWSASSCCNRLVRLAHDQMRTAAQFQYSEIRSLQQFSHAVLDEEFQFGIHVRYVQMNVSDCHPRSFVF